MVTKSIKKGEYTKRGMNQRDMDQRASYTGMNLLGIAQNDAMKRGAFDGY